MGKGIMNTLEDGTFSIFPCLLAKGMPTYEQCALAWLWQHANRDGLGFPSMKTLAAEAGMSLPSMKRAIRSLVKRGLIRKQRRTDRDGRYTSNYYEILITGGQPDPDEGVLRTGRKGSV